MTSRTKSYLGILLLFLAASVVLNWPGLNAPVYFDTQAKIWHNKLLFERGTISSVIAIFPQRPLVMASFYLNYLAAGMNPIWFRIGNLFMLAVAASLLVLIINLILDLPGVFERVTREEKRGLSILLGAAFLVHPFQTFVTLYIWQRMALMSFLFYFAALFAYLATRTGRVGNRGVGYALSLVLFALAMLSKESAVTLPAVLVLLELGFFFENGKDFCTRILLFALVLLGTAFSMSFMQQAHGGQQFGSGILGTLAQYYREAGLSVWQVILTQCRVAFTYLSALVLPLPGKIQLIGPQVISSSFLAPATTLIAVLGCGALAAAGL